MHRTPAYKRFFAELKRRKVFRVTAVYGAAAFAVMEVADLVFPRIPLPDWTVSLVVWLALLGFPVVVVMAWVFERTEEGLRLTGSATNEEIDAIASEPAGRRWPAGLAALIGVVLLATGAWTVWRVATPRAPTVEESRLAVFPFDVSGAGGLQWLDEGLPTLLSQNLLEPGEVETVDPAQVFRVAPPGSGRGLPVREAGEHARDLGAGRFVVGTVQSSAGRVRIHAGLYALQDSVHALARGQVEGDTTQIFDLVDRLTAQLLGESADFGAASRDLVRTAGRTTGSLAALRAYLEGERHLRNGQVPEAGEAFQRAVERDSTFGMAMYRQAFADLIRGDEIAAADWVERALRNDHTLSAYDQQAAEALAAYLDGRIAEAEQSYRSLTGDYPSRLDARVLLMILLSQYDPLRGRPADEALALLRQIRAADPGYLCIACISGQIHQEAEEISELWADQIAIINTLPDSARGGTYRALAGALHDLALGDTVRWRRGLDSLLAAAPADSLGSEVILLTTMALGQVARTDALVSNELAGVESGDRWALHMDWARGRWRAAYDKLEADDEPEALRALLHSHAVDVPLGAEPPDADSTTAQMLRWDGPLYSDIDMPELVPHMRLYGAALVRLQDRDTRRALALADSMADLPTPDHAAPVIRNAVRAVRGEAALRAGDIAGARAQLENLEWEFPPRSLRLASVIGPRPLILRGEAAWQDGDPRSARPWFDGGAGLHYGDYSMVQIRRAHIAEALGDLDWARSHYARAVEALEPADPELRSRREEARRRLEALVEEEG